MSNSMKEEYKISFSLADVRYARDHLIAASGLLHAIHHQYTQKGQLSAGALLHVAGVVDGVIHRMDLDNIELDMVDLPF